MKGATRLQGSGSSMPKDFNPRSREGSDQTIASMIAQRPISIHAPVKGATTRCPFFPLTHQISIHAPVKGATPNLVMDSLHSPISIHAPVKGATKPNRIYISGSLISIHAPVKGATARSCTVLGKNHLSRKENSSRISNFCLIFVCFLRERPAFL